MTERIRWHGRITCSADCSCRRFSRLKADQRALAVIRFRFSSAQISTAHLVGAPPGFNGGPENPFATLNQLPPWRLMISQEPDIAPMVSARVNSGQESAGTEERETKQSSPHSGSNLNGIRNASMPNKCGRRGNVLKGRDRRVVFRAMARARATGITRTS
jgi:hypothetical protein